MCPKVSMSPAVTGETHWRLEATQGRDRRPHNDVRMLFEAANKPSQRFQIITWRKPLLTGPSPCLKRLLALSQSIKTLC